MKPDSTIVLSVLDLAAVIGGPKTVERKLREFLQLTQANELILHSDFYRVEDRLHSYEMVAGPFLKPTAK